MLWCDWFAPGQAVCMEKGPRYSGALGGEQDPAGEKPEWHGARAVAGARDILPAG